MGWNDECVDDERYVCEGAHLRTTYRVAFLRSMHLCASTVPEPSMNLSTKGALSCAHSAVRSVTMESWRDPGGGCWRLETGDWGLETGGCDYPMNSDVQKVEFELAMANSSPWCDVANVATMATASHLRARESRRFGIGCDGTARTVTRKVCTADRFAHPCCTAGPTCH